VRCSCHVRAPLPVHVQVEEDIAHLSSTFLQQGKGPAVHTELARFLKVHGAPACPRLPPVCPLNTHSPPLQLPAPPSCDRPKAPEHRAWGR
jgi:hypothetical protein